MHNMVFSSLRLHSDTWLPRGCDCEQSGRQPATCAPQQIPNRQHSAAARCTPSLQTCRRAGLPVCLPADPLQTCILFQLTRHVLRGTSCEAAVRREIRTERQEWAIFIPCPEAAGILQRSPNETVKLDRLHEQADHCTPNHPHSPPHVSPDFVTSLQFETSMGNTGPSQGVHGS